MKAFTFFILLSLNAVAWSAPSIGPAPVSHLYVPVGFDNNDSVEVVVTGEFPNPCYRRNTVKVSVRQERISILVTAIQPTEKRFCPNMVVPFKEVISLGNLQGGEYLVTVNQELKEKLLVETSESGAVDDHLYAAIDEVEQKNETEFILHGWRYSPCIELERIEVLSNKKDTLSILPIMKQVSGFCPMKLTPVAYPIKLSMQGLKTKQPLIHVRTMDGKSFNTILNMGGRR